MVSKIKTLPQQAKEGALEKEDRETVADSPLAGRTAHPLRREAWLRLT